MSKWYDVVVIIQVQAEDDDDAIDKAFETMHSDDPDYQDHIDVFEVSETMVNGRSVNEGRS